MENEQVSGSESEFGTAISAWTRTVRAVALCCGRTLERFAARLLRVGRGQTGKYGQFPPGYIHGSQTAHLNVENGNLEIRSWNTDGYQSVSFFPQRTDPEWLSIVADREYRLRPAYPDKRSEVA